MKDNPIKAVIKFNAQTFSYVTCLHQTKPSYLNPLSVISEIEERFGQRRRFKIDKFSEWGRDHHHHQSVSHALSKAISTFWYNEFEIKFCLCVWKAVANPMLNFNSQLHLPSLLFEHIIIRNIIMLKHVCSVFDVSMLLIIVCRSFVCLLPTDVVSTFWSH